jgi:large subunit ribosomal protein L17
MHRHGYKGRKFGRERDQRGALMRGLTLSLFEHQSITTTVPKAKELRPVAEKLITIAKKGGLANRRLVISRLGSIDAAHQLVDVIAPAISRDSGYLRITKLDEARVGDNAEMARIEFVDTEAIKKAVEKADKAEPKPTTEPAKSTKPAEKETK